MLMGVVVCVQVEARQKLNETKEKEEDEEKMAKMNEDAPGIYKVDDCTVKQLSKCIQAGICRLIATAHSVRVPVCQ